MLFRSYQIHDITFFRYRSNRCDHFHAGIRVLKALSLWCNEEGAAAELEEPALSRAKIFSLFSLKYQKAEAQQRTDTTF